MSSGTPPPNPSWRDPQSSSGDRGWQNPAGGPGSPTSRRMSRLTKLVLAIGAAVAICVTVVVVVLLFLPPRLPSYFLVGASYDENLALPHNLPGWQAMQELETVAKPGSSGGLLAWLGSGKRSVKKQDQLKDETTWAEGLPANQNLVVFLALHGGIDSKGAFFFVDDPACRRRLRLPEVLDRLGQKSLAGKKKVLILDPTIMTGRWTCGQLGNDFVRQLKELKENRNKESKDAGLYILCASDEGQRSWVSEEWRCSIFAHYVLEGLRGAAADSNGRVQLKALHDYVHDQVKQWTRDTRNAVQTPILLGPAEDKEGKRAAASLELARVDKKYKAEEPQEAPGLPGLKEAWETFDGLRRNMVPSFAVYTPHLWHQYQETLLRLEQVLRAGDPTGVAKRLQDRLKELERVMDESRKPKLTASAGNTLPLSQALGLAQPLRRDLGDLVVELWRGGDAEMQKKNRERLKKEQDRAENDRKLLNVQLAEYLVQELSSSGRLSKDDLKRAREVLHDDLRLPTGVWPAEAHYLAILERDLATPPPSEYLVTALKTRLRAERAALGAVSPGPAGSATGHPYSEQVIVWTRDKVEEGDRERRRGEDLLLASGEDDWRQAGQHFQKANEAYRQAESAALMVRKALQLRDEVFDELPAYTQWLARQRRLSENQVELQPDERLKECEQLWQQIYQLAADLGKGEKADSLEQRADKLRPAFDRIRQVFQSHSKQLVDSEVRLQNRLQQIEDVLMVPFIEADRRLELVKLSRQISLELQQSLGKAPAAQADPLAEKVEEAGQREGRLGLALLGEKYNENALANLVKAGERLEKLEEDRRQETAKDLHNSLAQPKLDGEVGALALAAQAEQLARQVDGAANTLFDEDRPGPGAACRDLRSHDLLLWLLKRTARDHFYPYEPGGTPYYILAGNNFWQDARQLAATPDQAIVRGRQRNADLAKETYLKKTGVEVTPPLGGLASLQIIPLIWTARPQDLDLDGTPVFWFESKGRVKLQSPAPDVRFPRKLEKEITLKCEVINPLVGQGAQRPLKNASIALAGRFRGQILDTPSTQAFAPADVLVYQYRPSPTAAVAFRAHPDVSRGNLVIVLDASGSMYEVNEPWSRTLNCKFHEATRALEGVLKQLPAGTNLSVWVFGGHKDPAQPNQVRIWQLRKPRPWDRFQLERLMDEVENIQPGDESPIVRTMIQASADLDNTVGPKTMLVLTDGADNKSGDGPSGQLLEHFRDRNILINVVLFRVTDPKERRLAEEQFGVVRNLRPQGRLFPEPGANLSDKEQVARLPGILEDALLPRAFLLKDGHPLEGSAARGVRVSFESDLTKNLAWLRVQPDLYGANVFRSRTSLRVNSGERLLVSLEGSRSDEFVFKRGLFAEDRLFGQREFKHRAYQDTPSKNWRAAVMQNGYFAANHSLEMLLTLEELNSRDALPLHQVQPGFRWLEIKARQEVPAGEKEKRPSLVRWYNDERYPAPAWQLKADQWPLKDKEPLPAEVAVWWQTSATPPRDAVVKIDPDRLLQRGVAVNGQDEVTIQCGIDRKRMVSIAPDTPPIPMDCLVLTVNHKPGQPIWAQLVGHQGGQEHQYISQGDSYTAVFWGIRDSDLEALTFQIELTSIAKFKKEAEMHSRFDRLPEPSRGDPGPDKVVPD